MVLKGVVVDIPRRAHIDKLIPEELAIRDAMLQVEAMGAHVFLTDAVTYLQKAKDKVSDWYDAKEATMTDDNREVLEHDRSGIQSPPPAVPPAETSEPIEPFTVVAPCRYVESEASVTPAGRLRPYNRPLSVRLDTNEMESVLLGLQAAGCTVCGVTRFILAYQDDPFAVERHTAHGVFRMACEHCAMTRERDQWQEEARVFSKVNEQLVGERAQLQAQLQAAQAHLEAQQQATNQAVAPEQQVKERVPASDTTTVYCRTTR